MAHLINDVANNDLAESDSDCFDETEGEALLLSVFDSCNINENGHVKVSKLIDHLLREASADENPKILGYLDELAIILDPSGTDISIDKTMYNQGIRSWIQNVQTRRSFQDFEDGDVKLMDKKGSVSAFVYRGRGESDQNLPVFVNGYGERSLENHSFYSSESSNEWEKSQSEILGRIQELQIANKKLIEEKGKLRLQVDSTEESNSMLHTEIKTMKSKLNKYEQLVEKNKSTEKEYELLKNTVNDCRTAKEELIIRTSQLEKENSALQLMVDDYQRLDLSKNTALEAVREENRELLQKLNEQKQLYSDLEILKDLKQKMVDESSSKSECMTSFIAELSMANEALKAEKNRLQVDLLEAKHEISKLASMQTPSRAISRQPIYASTPFQKNPPVNLQQELDAELVADNFSMSSKDQSGRIGATVSDKSNNTTNESAHSDASASTAASTDKYSSVAQQIALNFKKKKNLALKQIAELAAFDTNSDDMHNSEVLMKNYEEGLDTFASEVEGLATAKQLAESRSAKLLESLELAKAENKRLAECQERALLKLGDMSLTRGEMEQRINDLNNEIDNEKQHVEDLISENEKLKEQLSEVTKSMKLKLGNDDLKRIQADPGKDFDDNPHDANEQQIKELMSLVADLEDRVRNYTRQLFEHEELIGNKDEEILEKSQEIQRLKTEYLEIKTKHENDLREVLVMFSFSGDSPGTAQALETPSVEYLKKKFEGFMAAAKLTLQNMGIRDGPIGSEGNEYEQDDGSNGRNQAQFADRHLEIGLELKRDSNIDTKMKSFVNEYCQTDLRMLEVEEAIHAFTMLKALQHKESDEDWFDEDNHELHHSHHENGGGICAKINENRTDSNDGLPANFIENREGVLSDKEGDLQDNPVSSDFSSRTIPGLKEYQVEKDKIAERVSEVGDVFDELISGKTEQTTDHNTMRGIVDSTWERTSQKLIDNSTDDSQKERLVNRRPLTRSDSVSTDESNTSDEMGEVVLEYSPNDRKTSTKSECSTVDSEVSAVSTASKRARRIGISAEPVRLPTWTELRESIKLNQQIFLEEEMTNEQLIRTPRNSVDALQINGTMKDVNYNEQRIIEKIDGIGVTDSSNLADTSMEWCYEFPSEQTNKSNDVIGVKQRNDGITVGGKESRNSVTSSVHSLAESIQTINSSASSKMENAMRSNQGTAEEEKSIENISETKDRSGELRRDQLLQRHEEHSAINISQVEKDLEKRYNTAVLSFKTDQYTLQRRLENQERARDVAESGMEREIRKLTEKLQSADKLSFTRELKEILANLISHTDILRKAGMKVSAQAEQHGCFQQESRIAPTIETLISYAEHLRLSLERNKEAEEIRSRETSNIDSDFLLRKDIGISNQKYGFCRKCSGRLKYEDVHEIKEEVEFEEEKGRKEKSNSLTFFGLASSILRERKRTPQMIDSDMEKELTFEEKESFAVKPDILNYSKNETITEEKEEEEDNQVEIQRPGKSVCNCLSMVLRFLVSVVMLSIVLFLFANYVELDLTRMINNWNEQLMMYSKRFFSKKKESL